MHLKIPSFLWKPSSCNAASAIPHYPVYIWSNHSINLSLPQQKKNMTGEPLVVQNNYVFQP